MALVAFLGLMSTSAMAQDWLRAFPEGVVTFGMAVVSFAARDIVAVERLEFDNHPAMRVKFAADLARAFSDASRGKPLESAVIYFCGSPIPGNPKLVELSGADMVLVSGSMDEADILFSFLIDPSCPKLTS